MSLLEQTKQLQQSDTLSRLHAIEQKLSLAQHENAALIGMLVCCDLM